MVSAQAFEDVEVSVHTFYGVPRHPCSEPCHPLAWRYPSLALYLPILARRLLKRLLGVGRVLKPPEEATNRANHDPYHTACYAADGRFFRCHTRCWTACACRM